MFRKINQSTVDGLKDAVMLKTVFPAVLNSLSEGTEVACIHSNFCASLASVL